MSEFKKQLESEQKKLLGTGEKISYSDKKIYERFTEQLSRYTNNSGSYPDTLGHDAKFLFECRQKKLKSMGLEAAENITPVPMSELSGRSFSDDKYTFKRLYKTFRRHVHLKDSQGKSFEKKENIYADVNFLFLNPNSINDSDRLCCPSCGNISGFRQLEAGCEKCGKISFITELFPRITGFFYRKNKSITVVSIAKTLFICCIIGFFAGFPIGLFEFIKKVSMRFNKDTISDSISAAFSAPISGIMAGVVFAVLMLLVGLIYDNVKNSALNEKTNQAKKKISEAVKQHEKSFCYENFEVKVISLLKLALYCDEGERPVNCRFDSHVRQFNIADSVYSGFTELKKIHIEYSVCTVTLDVYMSDIYYDGKKFYSKDDIFTITLSKRLSKKSDIGFEISNVTCPVCFEHFNAFRNKECGFCGSEFKPEEKDWVLTDLKLK